jgi:putative transposase
MVPMPDHVHFLVEIDIDVSLEDLVKRFKQLSGFRLKRVTGQPAWRVSYCDHVLRREETLLDFANYIWHNPVAAGLASREEEYLFSGPRESFRET